MNYDRSFAERMKQNYPPGTRIVLEHMDDPYAPVPPGTRGTVQVVDDMGTIFPKWDNGRFLGVVPGEDSFRKLTQEELHEEDLQRKFDTFTTAVEDDIFAKIDFAKLGTEQERCEFQYTREILREMHEAFLKVYGTDTVDGNYGYLAVPAVVEAGMTGEVYPALLGIDFSSSGEHWHTTIITPDGIKVQNNDERIEDNDFFSKEVCPYRYWYTLRCEEDIHTSLEDCPSDIQDILVDCNENLFDQTGGMNLC